ncbi:MAG: hypothetical protein RLY20_3535 [Verrucomicrobiota bacterium]|jgi:multidrug resistance efflux pump
MESITTLTQALEAVASANAQISALKADVEAAQALMSEQSAQAAHRISQLEEEARQLSEALATAKAETKQVERVQEIQVNEILASVGVAPVDISLDPVSAKAKSKDELWAEYHALPIEARNDFYAKNKQFLKS